MQSVNSESGRGVGQRFARPLAALCVALWLAGSVSITYGTLDPQGLIPHCPQGQSEHTAYHCAWHCDAIDEYITTGCYGESADIRARAVQLMPASVLLPAWFSEVRAPRGPPAVRPSPT